MGTIINMVRGGCMAFADSVPGVSGGTVAFIMGFYDKFIGSLDNIIHGTKEERITSVIFLLKLLVGWVIGFLIAVVILGNMFEKNVYVMCSLFLGFSIFAFPLIIKSEKEYLKGKYVNIIFAVLGAALVCLITYLNPTSDTANTISGFNIGTAVYVFIAAMVAISAMILPGISGSTILLILGIYMPVINGIKSLLSLDFSSLPMLICFGIGIIFGIVLIIRIVKICLNKFRSQTIYFILGLMLGSLYAIINGPTTLDTPQPAMDLTSFSVVFFLIGGAVIIGLEQLKRISEPNINRS